MAFNDFLFMQAVPADNNLETQLNISLPNTKSKNSDMNNLMDIVNNPDIEVMIHQKNNNKIYKKI